MVISSEDFIYIITQSSYFKGMIKMIFIEEIVPLVYKGHETMYLITDSGRVINKYTNRELIGSYDKDGYRKVSLQVAGKQRSATVHRLVALHFVSNPHNYPVIDHLDGNKQNNHATNLEWVTVQENTQRAYNMGLIKPKCGEEHGESIYTTEQIIRVCELICGDNLLYKDISKITGVSEGMINRIRNRKAWIHISKDYNFPISKYPDKRTIPDSIKSKMKNMIKVGLNNSEILDILNIPYSNKNTKIITRLRKKV